MATKIRLKRRVNDSSNTDVKIDTGEPFYNAEKKNLYIGNTEGEALRGNKKHIAELTKTVEDGVIRLQVGEDEDNVVTFEASDFGNDFGSSGLKWKTFK